MRLRVHTSFIPSKGLRMKGHITAEGALILVDVHSINDINHHFCTLNEFSPLLLKSLLFVLKNVRFFSLEVSRKIIPLLLTQMANLGVILFRKPKMKTAYCILASCSLAVCGLHYLCLHHLHLCLQVTPVQMPSTQPPTTFHARVRLRCSVDCH